MEDDDMVPHTADINQQSWLSLKPLFAANSLTRDSFMRKYACPNCRNTFDFEYPNAKSRKITSQSQLKIKCPCSCPWKTGKFFCPCCSVTNDTEGPIETHFVNEHAKKTRFDTINDTKPKLFKKIAMCPI